MRIKQLGVALGLLGLLSGCAMGQKAGLLQMETDFENTAALFVMTQFCGRDVITLDSLKTTLEGYARKKGAEEAEIRSLLSIFTANVEMKQAEVSHREACKPEEAKQAETDLQQKLATFQG